MAEWRSHTPSPDGMTNTILKAGAQIAVQRFNEMLANLGDLQKAVDAMNASLGKQGTDGA